ncbi:DUF6527 family protein (plasmid) [Pseudomonas mandelii]|uniref:DUF6527 family protein n=1 Tax=Pseudomonas mandelii TaxID=75612 RepID=UPI00398C9EA7
MPTVHRMKLQKIQPVFVEFIPEKIEPGKLYISEKYETAIHKCCCGCGEEVVTPLSPAEWRLSKGPSGVSLSPSIGNWDYPCRSHYFIAENAIVWAGSMSDRQIQWVKARDQRDMERHIAHRNFRHQEAQNAAQEPAVSPGFGVMVQAAIDWLKSLFKR